MESLGNVNHAISILWYWIFDSNYEKALYLTQESLDIICSPSVGKEQIAMFRSVFYTVRYILGTNLYFKKTNVTPSVKRLYRKIKTDKNKELYYIYKYMFDKYMINNYI